MCSTIVANLVDLDTIIDSREAVQETSANLAFKSPLAIFVPRLEKSMSS